LPDRLVAGEAIEIDGKRSAFGDGHELERIGLRFTARRDAGRNRRWLVLMPFMGEHRCSHQQQHDDCRAGDKGAVHGTPSR
jgi:hypothetical protein